MNADKTNIRRI